MKQKGIRPSNPATSADISKERLIAGMRHLRREIKRLDAALSLCDKKDPWVDRMKYLRDTFVEALGNVESMLKQTTEGQSLVLVSIPLEDIPEVSIDADAPPTQGELDLEWTMTTLSSTQPSIPSMEL